MPIRKIAKHLFEKIVCFKRLYSEKSENQTQKIQENHNRSLHEVLYKDTKSLQNPNTEGTSVTEKSVETQKKVKDS
jgi:hypothetical protein